METFEKMKLKGAKTDVSYETFLFDLFRKKQSIVLMQGYHIQMDFLLHNLY